MDQMYLDLRLVGNICMLTILGLLLIITLYLLSKLVTAAKASMNANVIHMLKFMIPNTLFLLGDAIFNFILTHPDQNFSKANPTVTAVGSIGSGLCAAAAAFFPDWGFRSVSLLDL